MARSATCPRCRVGYSRPPVADSPWVRRTRFTWSETTTLTARPLQLETVVRRETTQSIPTGLLRQPRPDRILHTQPPALRLILSPCSLTAGQIGTAYCCSQPSPRRTAPRLCRRIIVWRLRPETFSHSHCPRG